MIELPPGVALWLVNSVTEAFALDFVRKFVLAWVWLYTSGVFPIIREDRRNEMRSDLWENEDNDRKAGYNPRSIAYKMLWRLVRGIPADISWWWSEAQLLQQLQAVFSPELRRRRIVDEVLFFQREISLELKEIEDSIGEAIPPNTPFSEALANYRQVTQGFDRSLEKYVTGLSKDKALDALVKTAREQSWSVWLSLGDLQHVIATRPASTITNNLKS